MKRHFSAFLTISLLAGLITACNSPMGLGKPVDTLAPTIVIDTPADNEFIRGILLGSPVIITGFVADDLSGPDKLTLSFEMYNKTAARSVQPDNVVWEIDEEGRWRAEITITAGEGAEDYTIKVIAQDAFKNKGSAVVNVRLDIVPPWIRDSQIVRHPNSGFNFSSALYSHEHYVNDDYLEEEAFRHIPFLKIDEYQNEVFTVRVEIEPSYADVAASRLYVKNRDDVYLHETELVPSGYWRGEGVAALRYPEWEISASQLAGWNPVFSSGASYISFEVWAYSEAAWDKVNDRPFPGEPGRVQKIGGMVWYPESDEPHVQINPDVFVNNAIVLERSADAALAVDFYDDDRLGVIYMKLLPKLDFLALCGGLTEEAYLNSLIDPADPHRRRASLIRELRLTNELAPITTGDGRFQRVDISSRGLELGEYRLIALARDDKSIEGYSFENGAVESWGVYPPVSIQVNDINAPFIFVEKPEVENIFPDLISGESFIMSGFILGRMETISLNIAWVPKALQGDGLNAAIAVLESDRAAGLSAGGSFVAANGVTVWGIELREDTDKTILNGIEYFKVEFEKNFHIVDDFEYNNSLENDDKLLVLHAANYSSQVYSTFSLLGLTTGPDVEVTEPAQRGTGHDPNEDLMLKMKVSQAADGAAIKPNSQTILDITVTESNAGFEAPTALVGDEWTRMIRSNYIMNAYDKGMTRTYAFRAQDILGNVTEITREIIFTDQPLLESIACTETAGIFGIDQELSFEATFSMPVRVTQSAGQTVRLKLYLTDPGTNQDVPTALYADYNADKTPSGKTIFFTYIVEQGHTTPLLCTSLDAIVLEGGAMIRGTAVEADLVLKYEEGLLQSNSKIELDGERPFVTRASFAQLAGFYQPSTGVSYFTNGKVITIKLVANDTIKVTGNPSAVIRYGSNPVVYAQYAYKTTEANRDTLFFTHTFNDAVGGSSGNITTLTQLEWGAPWFNFPEGSAITDMAGNGIRATGYDDAAQTAVYLTPANRRGQPSEQGYVKTTIPATPGYTLHRTQAQANSGSSAIPDALPPSPPLTIMTNTDTNLTDIYIRVTGKELPDPLTGLGGATLYYSLTGGGDPQTVTVTGNNTDGTAAIPDKNNANKYATAYEKSQYKVTAWQQDLAGNRSNEAATREVTINSRWPELISVEIGLPDGNYRRNTTLPFRLNFSDKVKKRSGVTTAMSCEIYASYAPNTADIDINTGLPREQTGVIANYTITNVYWDGSNQGVNETNVLCFDWDASPNQYGNFHDIKLTRITFNAGFEDLYGNILTAYSGTAAEGSGNPVNTNRPIGVDITAYKFQLNRPDIWIHVEGPLPVESDPVMGGEFYVPDGPGAWPFTARTGQQLNGEVMPVNGRTFSLTYDVPITKMPGKYIEIRPYGNWAVPPVLSGEEMEYLLNHENIRNNNEYKNRLVDLNINEVSTTHPSFESGSSYTKSTHGIVNKNGQARPDTTTKWVLYFHVDPHGTDAKTSKLREIFEAADWNVQRVHVGSNQVTINDNDPDESKKGRIATITLSENLLPGRIWSVTPDIGAFTDAAGNPSGRTYPKFSYRFWSPGTAAPVVRVNRGGDTFENSNSYDGPSSTSLGVMYRIPDIDTEVRIDCETPGASIRYALFRTGIQLPAAASTANVNGVQYNNVFVSKETNDVSFFGYNVTANGANNVKVATDGYYRNIRKRTVFMISDPETGIQEHVYEPWNGVFEGVLGQALFIVQEPLYDGPTTGYARNTIGNDNYGLARDPNGFFNTLLRPNKVHSYPSTIITDSSTAIDAVIGANNGAPSYSYLQTMRNSISNNWSVQSGAATYRTVSQIGAVTRGANIDNNGYFYIGEAYETSSKGAANGSDSDPRLYTGRRDYIVAAAKKDAVISGNPDYQGPALDPITYNNVNNNLASPVSMEGVYKTTVILREPFQYFANWSTDFGANKVWINGMGDLPITTVSGFAFRGLPATNGAVGNTANPPGAYHAYRIGGMYVFGDTPGSGLNRREGTYRHDITNNYLWVTWDIVVDWYMEAYACFGEGDTAGFYNRFYPMKNSSASGGFIIGTTAVNDTSENSPTVININENFITATYGGIVYRYGQWFSQIGGS
jgi:hypothetical protein